MSIFISFTEIRKTTYSPISPKKKKNLIFEWRLKMKVSKLEATEGWWGGSHRMEMCTAAPGIGHTSHSC